MKRVFALIALMALVFLFSPRVASAVPASYELMQVKQVNGSTLNIRQWGDEHVSGFETEDGYAIVLDAALKIWYYAEKAGNGTLVPSTIKVGIDLLPANIQKHLRPAPLLPAASEQTISLEPDSSGKSLGKSVAAAVSGTKNIPVILANFSDTQFTYTANDFYNLLFSSGSFSLKDYYSEVSYNTFTVTAGSSGVVGPVTVYNAHDYYGKDINGTRDYYVADLVYEAVMAADAKINFAEYSLDGSCNVENVVIVHQGTGQEASPNTNDIWSKSGYMSSAKLADRMNSAYPGAYTTNDLCPSGGYMKVDKFTIQPEINSDGGMITVGVFAHEFGHVLGLPDLYDTSYVSEGVGYWSLMAAGSYRKALRSGDRPSHLDAWSKYKLGWVSPTQITSSSGAVNITAASTAPSVYQMLNGSPTSGEYFLVENRQKSGFDVGLPGSGLLVWHIDGDVITANTKSKTINNYRCYPPNNCLTNHYGVALVQADGLWSLEKNANSGDSGDPFPGTSNKTSFTDLTTPNSNLWNGTSSNVSITNISASGPTMSATMIVSDCSYDIPTTLFSTQASSTSQSFQIVTGSTCSWKAVSNTSWITITSSGSSGTGSGTIAYNIKANTSTASRQGTITVGGKTFTVTQGASDTNAYLYGILQNGNFEHGHSDWIEDSSGNFEIITTKNAAHAGYWSATLGGYDQANDSIRQTIAIPSGVSKATLSFWYKITSAETDNVQHDNLNVKVLDQYDSNNVLATPGSLSNLNANSAYQMSQPYDLSAFIGKSVQLSFAAITDGASPTTFIIDDVVIETTSSVTVSASPMRDLLASGSGQGSITITSAGTWTAVSDSSWLTILTGATGTGNSSVTYSVTANTGSSLRKAIVNVGDKAVTLLQAGSSEQSLITNGSFENGNLGWTQYSAGRYGLITNKTSYPAQSGTYYAWLAGYNNAYDYVSQKITIPSNVSDVFLQYYRYIETTEASLTSEYDRMYVYLSDPATGNVLNVFRSYSNLSETGIWYKSIFDLSPYKGKSLNLVFSAINDSLYYTSFLIDNVTVKAYYDTNAPVVINVSPTENSTNIAPPSSIRVTMSKQIDPNTLGPASFSVKDGPSTLAGSTAYDSNAMAVIFTPFTKFDIGKTYTVTLTTDIKDFYNNALTQKSYSFSTAAAPADGLCGSSNGGTFSVAPTTGLCSNGPAAIVNGSGPWSWSCGGTAGCFANLQSYTATFLASGGGSLSGTTSQTIYYGASTSAVTAIPATGYHFVNWTGTNGFFTTSSNPLTVTNVSASMTVTANFAANPVDGACGASSGQFFATEPTANLCSIGAASVLTGTGPWSWICGGANGGSVATCKTIILKGDVTGDGKIDISDALKVLQMAVGLVAPLATDYAAADVGPLKDNKPFGDGLIDIADALVILEKAVGLVKW